MVPTLQLKAAAGGWLWLPEEKKTGRNKTEPCPGFANRGLAAGGLRPKVWAQAWQGLREDGRHSLVPVRPQGHCVQQLLGLNKNGETFC